jgi:hypothetical protein
MKVPDLPREAIGAYRCLADYDYAYRNAYGDRPIATRRDIPPQGMARIKYCVDGILFRRGESL